jgi:N-acetylneuraminic acid mutarotase
MRVQRLLFMAMSVALFSCGNGFTNNNGDWVSRAVYNGPPRAEAVAFSIGDTGYVGLGFGNNSIFFNDFYKFSPHDNIWYPMPQFPGYARAMASSFATAKYGYVGLGINTDNRDGYPLGSGTGIGGVLSNTYLKDFWRYDPENNKWDSMPPVPISPATGGHPGRYEATGFGVPSMSIGAFLGGYDDAYTYNDMYVWTEAGTSGSWSALNYPGPPRKGGVAFVYNNHVYVVTGSGTNGQMLNDFWYWDPSKGIANAQSWQHNNWPNGPGPRPIGGVTDQSYDAGYRIARTNAVAFTMNNNGIPMAYVMFGSNGANLSDVWEYDFAYDVWTPRTPYPPQGLARTSAIALTINDSGYVGLGTAGPSTFFSDFTQFYPSLPYNQDDYTNY